MKTYRDPALALQMLEDLRLPDSILALDVSAGQGDGSRHLRAAGASVVFVDKSLAMLQAGVRRGTVNAHTSIVCDVALGLPFCSDLFDVVSMRYALHDIEDKSVLLRDIHRVARRGARVQITDMCANGTVPLDFYNMIHAWKTRGDVQPCWIADERTYESLLEEREMRLLGKTWYVSAVSSREWLREGQITARRHEYLVQMVRDAVECYPRLGEVFGLEIRRASFRATFPVLILTAEVTRGG